VSKRRRNCCSARGSTCGALCCIPWRKIAAALQAHGNQGTWTKGSVAVALFVRWKSTFGGVFFLLRAHNRLPEDFFSITDCTRKCTRLQIFLLGLLKILPRFL
jgi:hypothetical protein